MTDQQPPLQIAVVPVTPFQQNCSIVWEPKSNEAAIVDPGGDVPRLQAAIKELGVTPVAIWLTPVSYTHLDVYKRQAQHAATPTGLPDRELFEALLQRERLGSTGIGDGIAIPHGRMPGIDRLVGLFARTEKPIDFDALDGQPVDIIFVLIAPEGAGADHLKALARVARVLRNQSVLEQVRKIRDPAAIYAILAESAAQAA